MIYLLCFRFLARLHPSLKFEMPTSLIKRQFGDEQLDELNRCILECYGKSVFDT